MKCVELLCSLVFNINVSSYMGNFVLHNTTCIL